MAKLEVIPATERRRKFSDTEKERVVSEALGSGNSFSHTARKYNIAPPLLHRWIKLARSESKFSLLRVESSKATEVPPKASPVSVRIIYNDSVSLGLPPGTPTAFVLSLISELGRIV